MSTKYKFIAFIVFSYVISSICTACNTNVPEAPLPDIINNQLAPRWVDKRQIVSYHIIVCFAEVGGLKSLGRTLQGSGLWRHRFVCLREKSGQKKRGHFTATSGIVLFLFDGILKYISPAASSQRRNI